jgi:arylsulfatase A
VAASPAFRGRSSAGLYGDAVEELDWSVGQVVAALRKQGLERDSIIIFTSDNGSPHEKSNGGLRGGKFDWFEGGLRVPCIVSWPGGLPGGRVEDRPVSMLDMFPTLARWTGASLGSLVLDGWDVSDLLAGRGERGSQDFYWDNHAIRSGPWKLVPTNKMGSLLFNVQEDPDERKEVSRDHRDIVARLQAALGAHWRELQSAQKPASAQPKPKKNPTPRLPPVRP